MTPSEPTLPPPEGVIAPDTPLITPEAASIGAALEMMPGVPPGRPARTA